MNHSYSVFFQVLHMIFPSPCISSIIPATHVATSSLIGERVVPWMTASAMIQLCHARRVQSLNGLLKPTSTGWQREVQPPGMCCTSTPNSWIRWMTDPIMWQQ